MIESYFFIPANHPKLQEKLASIQADHIIIDLEDAVLQSDLPKSLDTVVQIKKREDLWIRPLLFYSTVLQSEIFLQLVKKGFKNFVIPKVRNLKQIVELENCLTDVDTTTISIILLVENPECLLNLNLILENTKFNVRGVGFGSQDFCSETGMKHTSELLRTPRFNIFCAAKAHHIQSIDIASMDIYGGESYLNDLKEALEMGYDGKFVIHPKQLKIIQNYKFYTSEEVNEAYTVISEYEQLGKPAIFIHNHRAIEPPHIQQYKKIINWNKKKNERK